ncbi:DUF2934 domain-containing protein, partial [Paraburkholderia sp. SIMBA_049]
LWEKDGSLEGCADEYWQQARAQIDEEESAADGSGTGSTSRLTRSRKPDAE